MRRLVLISSALLLSVALVIAVAQAQPARPAPTEDRVGFPEGYQSTFTPLYVFDRADNRQVRVVYGNAEAASATAGQSFPYGSILVMETYRALLDAEGGPQLDAQGRFIQGEPAGLFVMRKEPGFGAAYEMNRTGEWEYAQFGLDGTLMPPQNTGACAACHTDAGATRDWTWRTDLFLRNQSGALPRAAAGVEVTPVNSMQAYLFLPPANVISVGATFTWTNDDAAVHTVTANDGSFASGRLGPGQVFTHTFSAPGVYAYQCDLHPTSMLGTISVQ
jgi:plastocyanin